MRSWNPFRCRATLYPEMPHLRCRRVFWHRGAHHDDHGDVWARLRKGVHKHRRAL